MRRGEQGGGGTRYRVLLVTVEGNWEPTDWLDAPAVVESGELAAEFSRRSDAEGWVFGHNAQAGPSPREWAVIVVRRGSGAG